MSRNIINGWRKSFKTKSTLAIVITAAFLIEVTGGIQYWYARKGIQEEVENRAQSELRIKRLEIQNIISSVEVAVNNYVWAVEKRLDTPDSLFAICGKLLESNPQVTGAFMAFVPSYYSSKGVLFEPYVRKGSDGKVECLQLASESHVYRSSEFFTYPLEHDASHWCEPYLDTDGARTMVTTYSVPVHDKEGRVVAMLAADVSLEWLSEVLNASHMYPSSYNLVVSRLGKLMACPVESLVMRSSLETATSNIKDTNVNSVNRSMLDGLSGQAAVSDEQGEKNYVFYAPIGGGTGWSMAVVCSDREIYYGLRQVGFNLMLLMIAGLCLLTYLVVRMIKGFNRLAQVTSEKERIGSELRIASGIQMGMLPKTFPPYPDRDDVEIFGSLVPAKEVGGDLYDFYIRDEKLFFCIGDVSGKGVPASLVMAVTRSLFRTVSAHEAAPDRIVGQMNEAMSDMNESSMFVTFFIGVLDLPTGRLHLCNAGHCPPLRIGDGVDFVSMESNLPLGLMSDWKYVSQSIMVPRHTTLFLYTDGLTEAQNASGDLLGEDRMVEQAKALCGNNAPEIVVKEMSDLVHRFVGDYEQSDDLTMLAIKYTKEERKERLRRNMILPNDVKTVVQLSGFVREIAEQLGLSELEADNINLALEEAVVNVMNYAYPSGTSGDVEIEARANDVRLKFTIRDSGTPFDPTAKEDVDTTLSAEDRPIGGLGIYLVRQLMDSINYERVDGMNVLTLRKKL